MGGAHSEDDITGRPPWGEDMMRRAQWREHDGERTQCGEAALW